ELNEGMIIEEGSIPGALAGLLPAGLSLAGAGKAAATDFSLPQLVRQKGREFESLLGGAYKGAVHNTQTYLIMAHEQDSGRMRLQDDRLRIDWPGVGSEPIFETGNERLHEASLALDGVFVHNPTWSPLLRHNLVTVHPLGGCVMAEAAE